MLRSIAALTRPTFPIFIILLAARDGLAQPTGNEKPDPLFVASVALIEAHDRNGDGQLNADECPAAFRDRFAAIDVNHDGYLVCGELTAFLGRRHVVPGKAVAQMVYIVTDGIVVEVYHNGKPVPLDFRGIDKEVDGVTAERADIHVHEGDWLVFHVVANRHRGERGHYFAVAGELPGSPGFASSLTTGGWFFNDDPAQATAFIDNPLVGFGLVHPIEKKWAGGNAFMKDLLGHDWQGSAIWGQAPSTWIKYRVPKPPALNDKKDKKEKP